jgi:WD40 repeat protein
MSKGFDGFKALNVKEKSEVIEKHLKISLCNTFPLAECIQISSDSTFLLTGHQDGTIRKWSTLSTMKDLIVASHKLKVLSICLSDSHLISSGQDSKLKIWSLPGFLEIFSFDVKITSLTFQIASSCFFAGSEEGEIYKINLNNKSPLFKKNLGNTVSSLISLQNYHLIHVGCEDGRAFFIESDLNVFGNMMNHDASVSCACENDFKVITGSSDKFIRVWRTETQELLMKSLTTITIFLNLQIYKETLIITPLGKFLIFLNLDSLSLIQELNFEENLKCSLLLKNQLFYSGTHRNLRVFDLETRSTGRVLNGHKSNIVSLVLSSPPDLLASGGRDNTIRVWDLALGLQVKILYGHKSLVRFLCFADENSKILSISDDKTLKIWDLASETVSKSISVTSVHTKLSSNLSYLKGWISYICNDNTYQLWSMAKLEKPLKISRKYLFLLKYRKKVRVF